MFYKTYNVIIYVQEVWMVMKKSFLGMIMLVFLGAGAFAQASDVPFVYDKAKVQPGTVSFYRVTDMDKGQGFDFIVYQGDEKTFYSFGDFSKIGPLVQVGNEKYNTQIFCNDYGMNENPYSYAKMRNSQTKTEFSVDIQTKKMSGYMGYINLLKKEAKFTGSVELLMLPSYEISGFQMDLVYSMRFLKAGTKEFTVGCYTATKANQEKVSYLGMEKVKGINCEKWEAVVLDKKGNPKNEKQIFWFDNSDPLYKLVKSESNIDGTAFKNSLIELTQTKKMTKTEWDEFCKAKTEEIRIKLDIPAK